MGVRDFLFIVVMSLLLSTMVGTAAAFSPMHVPSRGSRSPSVSMAVEDLVGGINDPIFGGTPEGKIWDPLGLGADEASLYRRRFVEIKHGRVCFRHRKTSISTTSRAALLRLALCQLP